MKPQCNANDLKLIAIAAMTVDHIADLLYPGFPSHPTAILLHVVGRLTAPIMWFFVCEGFHYTRHVGKYAARMLIFALISHFAYCFAFGIGYVPLCDGILNQTSVMWPLFLSILALWVMYRPNSFRPWQKYLILAALCVLAFPADWSSVAVMAVVFMYGYRGDLKKQALSMGFWVLIYAAVSFFCVSRVYAIVQAGVILVYPLLKTYNGQKGRGGFMKWFFYLYYPLHLAVIGILRILMYGDVPLLF